MKRRELLKFLGSAAALALPARAEEARGKMFHVGIVSFASADLKSSNSFAFERRLAELGYVEGKTLAIDSLWLDGKIEGYPEAMAELVRRKVDVIVTTGQETAVKAAMQASATTPIIMQAIDFDPVARGYIASLGRPGGNITGVFLRQIELTAKRLELLKEAIPDMARAIVLWDAVSADQVEATVEAARTLKLQVKSVEFRDQPYNYASALASASARPGDALLFLTSPSFNRDRKRLAEIAVGQRLPSMFANRQYADAGGLMSYGPNYQAMNRLSAEYVDKILKGARPADLPVEQPTMFELVINLKTAQALGLTVPHAMLMRADEVIE